jgi:hypothetical protein
MQLSLSSLWNISRFWGVSWSWVKNPMAYLLDWNNDYISWDTAIWRVWIDINATGRVTTWTDWDWLYMSFIAAWLSQLQGSVLSYVWLSTAFTCVAYFKTGSDVTSSQRIINNVVWSSNRFSVFVWSWEIRLWIYNWTVYTGKRSKTAVANTLYKLTYTRDWSSISDMYIDNVQESTVPAWDPQATGAAWLYIWWTPAGW